MTAHQGDPLFHTPAGSRPERYGTGRVLGGFGWVTLRAAASVAGAGPRMCPARCPAERRSLSGGRSGGAPGDLHAVALGAELELHLDAGILAQRAPEAALDVLVLRRADAPVLELAARGQLEHWRVSPAQYEDIQRGFWRALSENAGVEVQLEFGAEGHRVQVTRRAA